MGKLVRSCAWAKLGDDKRDALSGLLKWQAYDIELNRWLAGGRSELPVALAERSGRAFTDKVAIKFFDDPDNVSKWQEASRLCPAAFKIHIAEASEPLGNQDICIMVLKVAGDDVTRFRPMCDMADKTGSDFGKACQIVIDSILKAWNPEVPSPDTARTILASKYFADIFNVTRISPGNPLHQWMQSADFTISRRLIMSSRTDEMIPNPLSFASWLDELPEKPKIQGRYGRAHGDLHLGNILMPLDPLEPEKYILIDLDDYNADAPLARDPMYLLLSIASDWLREITPGSNRSHQLIDAIVKPPGTIPAVTEYGKICHSIHNKAYQWGKLGGHGDDWTQQSMLSLAGCALRYASRKLDGIADASAASRWFLELAAVAAKRYLQESGLWDAYKKQSPTPAARPSQSAASSGVAEPTHENANGGAEVIHLPRSNDDDSRKSLADELRTVNLESNDSYVLCARTEKLRMLLRQNHTEYLKFNRRIGEMLSDLEQTLDEICSPPTANSELYATRAAAERLISWILDLIEE